MSREPFAWWLVGLVAVVPALIGCRDRAAPVRRDVTTVAPVASVDSALTITLLPALGSSADAVSAAPASTPATSTSGPANPEIDCFAWLNDGRDEPAPFPHRVHPGFAMGLVLEWAGRHHKAKQPSIGSENVRCPRMRCIEPDDCWYRIRLEDASFMSPTPVSRLVAWVDVHAQTGNVRWEEVGADGGLVTRAEPPSPTSAVRLPPAGKH